MADQLNIILSAKIGNSAGDIASLNRQIEQIQSKLTQLNLGITIDQKTLSSLNDFVKSIEVAKDISTSMTQVIKENIVQTKNLDGSIKTVTTSWLRNGDAIERTKTVIKQQTDETNNAQKAARQLATEWDAVGQKIKQATKQNGVGQQTGGTDVYQNGNTTQTVNYDSNGKVTSARTVDNLKAEQQATEKYNQAVSGLKDNITNLESRLTSLGEAGQHVSTEFDALTRAFSAEESSSSGNIASVQRLTEQYTQLEQELSRVEALGSRRIGVDASAFSGGQTQIDALRNYIVQAYAAEGATTNLEHTQVSLSSAFDSSGNAIQRYNVQFNDGQGNMRQYQGTVDQLSSSLYQNGERITQAGTELTGFNRVVSNFGKQMLQMPIWMASWAATMAPIEALHSIVSTIIEVDTAMTQLKRVMNTGTDFNSMLQQSIQMSTELGTKLTDILNIETEFARQGFSSADVLTLTKVSSLLVNIGDVTPTQAMTTLTAAMKNFNITASNSVSIADKLNNVSNNYSVDTSNLSDALTKAAATAKVYGVSLNDLLGMTSAISETTKESGDIIGNSLKTIFSRLESKSSVNVLKQIGVETQDASGKMLSATQVLGDLAGKWNSLTNTQQQSIAVTVAGRYQLTRFLALMQDWGTVVNASNTALNSQNSAMNENAKYQNSLQARLNNLNTAWKQLSLALGDEIITNSLTGLINGLKEITLVATPFVKLFGAFPLLLGTVGVALTVFNTKINASVTSIGVLQKAFTALGISSNIAKTAIASTGIGLAVVGVSMALEALINWYGKASQAEQQYQQKMDQSTQSYEANGKQIDSWVSQYQKLSDLKSTTGLDNSQQQQFLDIQQKIANVMPSVVSGTDAQGRSILESSKAIKENIALLQQKVKLDHDIAINNAPSTIQSSKSSISSYQSQIKQLQDYVKSEQAQVDAANKTINNPNTSAAKRAANEKMLSVYVKDINNAEGKILELKNKIITAQDTEKKSIGDILTSYQKLTSTDINWLEKLGTSGKVSASNIDKLASEVNTLRSELGKSIPNNFFSNMSTSDINNVSNLVDGYKSGNMTLDEFTKRLDSLGLSAKQETIIMDALTGSQSKNQKQTKLDISTMSDLSDAMGNASKYAALLGKDLMSMQLDSNGNLVDQGTQMNQLINTYSILIDKQSQLGKGAQLSKKDQLLLADVTQKLIELNPQLAQGKGINIDMAKKEADADSVLLDAMNKAAQGLLTNEQQMTLAKVSQTKDRIKAIQDEIDGLNVLKQAYNDYVDSVDKSLKNADAAELIQATHVAMMKNALANSSNASDLQKQLKALQSNLDLYTGSLKTSMDSTSSSSSTTTQAIDVTGKYTDQLNKLAAQISKVNDLTQKYPEYSSAYRKAIQDEIDLQQKKLDLQKQEESALNKQISSGNYTTTTYTSSGGSSSSGSGSSYSGKYSSTINKYASQYGVDPNLVAAVAMQESSMGAASSNVMQVNGMNGKGATASIQAGTKMLGQLLKETNGDISSALAAYNMGPGILSYFNSHGGYSASNMTAFSNMQKSQHGYNVYGDPNYVNNVMRYYSGGPSSSSKSSSSGSSSPSASDTQSAKTQAKSNLYGVQQDILDTNNQIQQLYLDLVNSHVAYFDHMKSQVETQMSLLDTKQSDIDQNSKEWATLQLQKEQLLKKEAQYDKDSITYLQSQIKYNKDLTDAQKATLSDEILQREQDYYGLEKDIMDARSQAADQIINTYKQVLQAQEKAAEDSINTMLNNIDKQTQEASYKSTLADNQNKRQAIVDQINALAMDNSSSAKSKLADLNSQLHDLDKTLSDNSTQHATDVRKQNLQDQETAIQNHYDNLLNDETTFAKMRSDIINGNNKAMIKDFNSFASYVKKNSKALGKAVYDNLLELIGQANSLLVGSNGKPVKIASAATGGITPSWGSQGKVMMVHQDEMISSRTDTKNLLKAMDMSSGLLKFFYSVPNFNSITPSTASGGNNYNINFNIDKLNGTKNDAQMLLSKIVTGVKSLGGNI